MESLKPLHLITFTQKARIRGAAVTLGALLCATALSALFFNLTKNSINVAIIYMLCVVVTARCTDGYLPGIAASVAGVFAVNYFYTYPYMTFNFTLAGYPVTFAGMLLISAITSTATTHLKTQGEALHEREKLLMEAEKEKMRANLLRAVSHDLRTPLTSIIGTSAAYLDGCETMDEAAKTEMVRGIYEDSNWLLNMVENLLSVTRIRTAGTLVSKTPEPLEEVAAEAAQRFQQRFPDARVNIFAPEEFLMVPMDAILIEQVIINLFENAYRHSGSKEPVELHVTAQDGFARFEVTDRGQGIPAGRLETLFDGYTPALQGGADSQKGMGIGLTICKTIVTAHGGKIFARNLEQGACFTFTLPLGEGIHEETDDLHH